MKENKPLVTSVRTITATRPAVETVPLQQLIQRAEAAALRYALNDAKADRWGRDSFPSSDPPQNY